MCCFLSSIEHLQSYFHDLDESSESESEVDFKPRTPTSVMQQHQPSRSVNETPATETWVSGQFHNQYWMGDSCFKIIN